MLTTLLAATAIATHAEPARAVRALRIEDFAGFSLTRPNPSTVEILSPPIDPGMEWDELVLSWGGTASQNERLSFFVRMVGRDSASVFYHLADWNGAPMAFGSAAGERTSVNGQKDEWARVDTDTLTALRGSKLIELKVVAFMGKDGAQPKLEPEKLLRRVTLSFRNSGVETIERDANMAAWGPIMEPPQRAQMSYENGGVICSPTATSMVLGFCAKTLSKPELDKDVPEVVRGVFDPAYKGTGNWSFNVAYAASLGLRAEVLRLSDLRDLEDLVAAGIPPVCSVSYAMLKGKPEKEPDDGHLVVLVGFNKEGDPVFNDPGRNQVRQTYKRDDFKRAWASSGRTIYLIHPDSVARPKLSCD